MELKKKLNNVFVRSRKNKDGFTLVELIVVIAILAILGGVAVPAYSGYVKKAEKAADEQLLAVVNRAYAAACLENGTDMALIEGASMPLNADKTVNVASVEPYGEAFATYYAGNEASAFKVFTSIVFDTDKHMFVNLEDAGSISITVNGVTYKADAESVAAYLNSSLGELGTQELLDMVGLFSNALGDGFGDDDFATIITLDSYKNAAAAVLGLSEGQSYDEYLSDKKESAIEQYIAQNYPNYEDLSREEKSNIKLEAEANADLQIKDIQKNLLPLVSASKAEEAGTDILEILQSDTAKDALVGNVNDAEKSVLGLSQSALAYALYTSYATSEGMEADPIDFLGALQGDDGGKFKEYLGKDQAKADLAGALGAMEIISNQNGDTIESTAINGLTNSDLEKALSQILGK